MRLTYEEYKLEKLSALSAEERMSAVGRADSADSEAPTVKPIPVGDGHSPEVIRDDSPPPEDELSVYLGVSPEP